MPKPKKEEYLKILTDCNDELYQHYKECNEFCNKVSVIPTQELKRNIEASIDALFQGGGFKIFTSAGILTNKTYEEVLPELAKIANPVIDLINCQYEIQKIRKRLMQGEVCELELTKVQKLIDVNLEEQFIRIECMKKNVDKKKKFSSQSNQHDDTINNLLRQKEEIKKAQLELAEKVKMLRDLQTYQKFINGTPKPKQLPIPYIDKQFQWTGYTPVKPELALVEQKNKIALYFAEHHHYAAEPDGDTSQILLAKNMQLVESINNVIQGYTTETNSSFNMRWRRRFNARRDAQISALIYIRDNLDLAYPLKAIILKSVYESLKHEGLISNVEYKRVFRSRLEDQIVGNCSFMWSDGFPRMYQNADDLSTYVHNELTNLAKEDGPKKDFLASIAAHAADILNGVNEARPHPVSPVKKAKN